MACRCYYNCGATGRTRRGCSCIGGKSHACLGLLRLGFWAFLLGRQRRREEEEAEEEQAPRQEEEEEEAEEVVWILEDG